MPIVIRAAHDTVNRGLKRCVDLGNVSPAVRS